MKILIRVFRYWLVLLPLYSFNICLEIRNPKTSCVISWTLYCHYILNLQPSSLQRTHLIRSHFLLAFCRHMPSVRSTASCSSIKINALVYETGNQISTNRADVRSLLSFIFTFPFSPKCKNYYWLNIANGCDFTYKVLMLSQFGYPVYICIGYDITRLAYI